MKHRLGLNREFSKQTIIANKLLKIINLRICKDCQKLTLNNSLRCTKCDEIHTAYRLEEAQLEIQEEWI